MMQLPRVKIAQLPTPVEAVQRLEEEAGWLTIIRQTR